MKHLFSIIIFLILPSPCLCQTFSIKGYIKNASGTSVAYTSIGIENNSVSCISNNKGYFELHIPDSLKNTQVTFSHLSYKKLLKSFQRTSMSF